MVWTVDGAMLRVSCPRCKRSFWSFLSGAEYIKKHGLCYGCLLYFEYLGDKEVEDE